MDELLNLRQEIEQIDKQLIKQLKLRLEFAKRIGLIKAKHNMKVEDILREDELKEFHQQICLEFNLDYEDFIQNIFNLIFEKSKDIQQEDRLSSQAK